VAAKHGGSILICLPNGTNCALSVSVAALQDAEVVTFNATTVTAVLMAFSCPGQCNCAWMQNAKWGTLPGGPCLSHHGYRPSIQSPWNVAVFLVRYRRAWQAAISARADVISITSYNEWGEGTQIEPARVWGRGEAGAAAGSGKTDQETEASPAEGAAAVNYQSYLDSQGVASPYLYMQMTGEFASQAMRSVWGKGEKANQRTEL
jgi:Glycosyl hydrolase family 99